MDESKRQVDFFSLTKRTIRIQTGSPWKFLQPPIQVRRGIYIPCFKLNVSNFCLSIFFKEFPNPQVKFNKWKREDILDYLEKSSLKICFSPGKRVRIMELKKWPKLNLQGRWWQGLINSTIFATFKFLVSILLC